MSHPLLLLFDADMILFESCAAVETEIQWEDDLWTLHSDAAEAKAIVDDRISSITDKVLTKLGYEGTYEIIMCFTDDNNFRKNILPSYKANRIGRRKPVCYHGVKEWVFKNYNTYQRPNLEADDCIGILATLKPNTVIISGDKDFKSVPGRFFNYQKDKLYETSEDEADYWHMFQTLIGDTTDNYSGCPGIGEKTAQKILAEGHSWDTIVTQFEKKGLTEHDALIQARVARILRKEDYDFKNKVVKLWEPRR